MRIIRISEFLSALVKAQTRTCDPMPHASLKRIINKNDFPGSNAVFVLNKYIY